jgi:hypothetical protein
MFSKINVKYRLEIMLVNSYGLVTERIYKSAWSTTANLSTYVWNFSIDIPFYISGGDVQLVCRIIAHPYSKNQTDVNITELQSEMSADGIKRYVGAWIKSFNITHNTLSKNIISQNVSAGGSPAYYEDLPISPGKTIGGDDFWFIAAEDLLHVLITFPDKPLNVTGTLYSPVFRHSLPKDIEVDYRTDISFSSGAAVAGKYLKFRTVPSKDGVSDIFLSVGATEDEISKSVYIVRPNFNDNDNTIPFFKQKNPLSQATQSPVQSLSQIKANMSYTDIGIQKTPIVENHQITIIGNNSIKSVQRGK